MLRYFLDGFSGPSGGFMWAITGVLAFAIAVLVDRVWMILVRCRFDEKGVRGAISRGDGAAAVQAAGRSPIATVLQAGLDAAGPDAAWDAMSAEVASLDARVRKRVGYLATIGNLSTMMGLLGNVIGIIIAFGSLGDASAEARAVHLSEGIATAMSATAYGLVVAIPALAAHAWLEQQARTFLAAVEAAAGSLVAKLREKI